MLLSTRSAWPNRKNARGEAVLAGLTEKREGLESGKTLQNGGLAFAARTFGIKERPCLHVPSRLRSLPGS